MENRSEISPILISCVGAYDDSGMGTGGFMLLDRGQSIIIDHLDCTGLYYYDQVYYRFIRSLKTLVGYDLGGICYTCKFPLIDDCHDILIQDNLIFAVSTKSNEIHSYDFRGKLIDKIKLSGEGDAWHLNCLEKKDDQLYVTAFGKFSYHREWNEVGCVGKGILYNLSTNKVEINGLNGPHHPRFIDNKWMICDSHSLSLRIFSSEEEYVVIDTGGFSRGLCVDGSTLCVGISMDRKKPTSENAHILTLDRKTFSRKDSIAIPFPEIYDLLPCSHDFAEAIRMNLPSFQLFGNDNRINALIEQVNLGEETNRELIKKLKSKPRTSLLEKILKKIYKLFT